MRLCGTCISCISFLDYRVRKKLQKNFFEICTKLCKNRRFFGISEGVFLLTLIRKEAWIMNQSDITKRYPSVFQIKDGCIYRKSSSKNGEKVTRLCNFAPFIFRRVLQTIPVVSQLDFVSSGNGGWFKLISAGSSAGVVSKFVFSIVCFYLLFPLIIRRSLLFPGYFLLTRFKTSF